MWLISVQIENDKRQTYMLQAFGPNNRDKSIAGMSPARTTTNALVIEDFRKEILISDWFSSTKKQLKKMYAWET